MKDWLREEVDMMGTRWWLFRLRWQYRVRMMLGRLHLLLVKASLIGRNREYRVRWTRTADGQWVADGPPEQRVRGKEDRCKQRG